MFPLGSVLFPHALLPLHVFEPRYRAMTEVCLAGDQTFGVVLIERGSEVGGGDVRFDTGTLARILRAEQLDDGRWVLVTAGTQRLRVREWLPDAPYPRADVEVIDESDPGACVDEVARVATALRRVVALRAELGVPGEVMVDLAEDDPVAASFQAAALAGVGPLDAQRLLETDDAATRLAALASLLDEQASLLEFRLSAG